MEREILKKIGLSDEEVNIYLLLLSLGPSKVTIISKELNLARSTAYRFLESLQQKGLVGMNIQENVKFFYPTLPERIPEILKEKAEEVKQIIPKLNSLKKSSVEETSVELFKGKEGIKTIMNDIIRSKKEYTFLGEAEKYFEELDMDIFSAQWVRKIEKTKIKGRVLCSEKQKFIIAKTEKYKLLPAELIPEITTWTYGNKTALFIWSKPFYCVLINNKQVTESNKKIFEYFWKIAKRPSKKHLERTRFKP